MAAKFVIALAVVGCVSGLQKREENKQPYDEYMQKLQELAGNFPSNGQMPTGFPGPGNFPAFPGSSPTGSSDAPSKRQTPINWNEYTSPDKWGLNPGNFPGASNLGPNNFPGFGGGSPTPNPGNSQSKRQIPGNFEGYTNPDKWGINPGSFPSTSNFPVPTNPFAPTNSGATTPTNSNEGSK